MPTSYEEVSKAELLEIAAERELEGRSAMTKAELIGALEADDAIESDETVPDEAAEPEGDPGPPQPLELIADPLSQAVYDDAERIEEAIQALDEALLSEEEADAPALLEARTFFNSFRYSTPFRYLVGLSSK